MSGLLHPINEIRNDEPRTPETEKPLMPATPDRANLLAALRSGHPLPADLRGALGDFLQAPLPATTGTRAVGIYKSATILRDRFGVPHIQADDADDLFFAYGYATAQDRLWQLDYLRRAAYGRLAEIFGADSLGSDIEVRTIGIGRLAQELEEQLPPESAQVLADFAAGVNAVIEATRACPPVEFQVLDYECEPWSTADSLALMKHFWWQLTGRLFLISGPEMLRRAVGDGPLYEAFLRSELQGESIIPPGENRAQPLPPFTGGGMDSGPPGSNNWAISPGKSATGKPLFASDPHTPYMAPTVWYEAHLHGAGYAVAGMGYVGLPGIIFGRNPHAAWGITNNICSQRDLFVDAADGMSFRPPPARHVERIAVKGGAEQVLNLATNDIGPLVNHLLPSALMTGPPVALRWVGQDKADEVGALLRLNRAAKHDEMRTALADWVCPTFNFMWAGVSGDIAYQTAGRLPRRRVQGRTLRPADAPQYRWEGFIPYECNPWCLNPRQGWIATANNPVLPDGGDHDLGGMFVSDARARRIRQVIEGQGKFTLADCAALQMDITSARLPDAARDLCAALAASTDARVQTALGVLRAWRGDYDAASAAPAIFEAFTRHWSNAVLAERGIPDNVRDLLTRHVLGMVFPLLKADPLGWFARSERVAVITAALQSALDDLATRGGTTWGDIHTLTMRHPVAKRLPAVSAFDTGPVAIGGAGHTVNNQWVNASGSYESVSGANCRIAADLGTTDLLITNCMGQSGHPGSPHYRDQYADWLAGRLHVLSLDWKKVEAEAKDRLELRP